MKAPAIIAEWVDPRKTDNDSGATYRLVRDQYDKTYTIYREHEDVFGNVSWEYAGVAGYAGSDTEDILAGGIEALAKRMRGEP